MKYPNDGRFTSAEMRQQADMCEKDIDDEFRSAAMLSQAADEKDARAKLEEELRETKKILGRTQDHVKILKSRLDKAELSALELRKELYKFGPKALYDMTAVIIDAIKGR